MPHPFGFSMGCRIQLNCSDSTSTISIGEFAINNFTSDCIILDVPHSCNRSIEKAASLFSDNYAITSQNNLIVTDCEETTKYSSSCLQHSPAASCANGQLLCLDEGPGYDFFRKENVTDADCKSFVSSQYKNNYQVIELNWWVEGGCDLCSDNTQCRIRSMNRKDVVTCSCNQGYNGDGFKAGNSCSEKNSSHCTYISGNCSLKSRIAVLIGGVVAGALLMGCLTFVFWLVKRRSAFSRGRKKARELISEASSSIPHYSYKEIERATDGFSDKNQIGIGAYGTVYYGKLDNYNDQLVAIKKLRNNDADSMEQVINEIKVVSSVSHPHLVRLLGCCIENGERILVYEYMPNGTLSQHLQRDKKLVLPWTVRLNIAADTAKAIAHLHSSVNPPIYHRDIKSSNILLNYKFESKVADFGLSRMVVTDFSHVSTAPQGTPGYVDPQYHQNFQLSDKSDVYSFGVVLVEMITAMKAVDFSRQKSEVNLAALAIEKIGKGCLEEIIDPYLESNKDSWTLSSINKVVELAFRCLAFHRDMRPTMMEVADELEQIRLCGWPDSDGTIALSTNSSFRSIPGKIGPLNITTSMDEKECISSQKSSPSSDSLLGTKVR